MKRAGRQWSRVKSGREKGDMTFKKLEDKESEVLDFFKRVRIDRRGGRVQDKGAVKRDEGVQGRCRGYC